jgi:DNA-binding XRE family transcriptional regulator
MNVFEQLVENLKVQFRDEKELFVRFGRPLDRGGFWAFRMVFSDDFLVSMVWSRHKGFMLTTGFDVAYGSSYDEIFADADSIFARIKVLTKDRKATEFQNAVSLADLRKLQGVTQTALAARVEMTKGGLSQIESEDDLLGMKVGTIKKLIDSLGGNLVLTARFPNGEERNLSIS